MTSDLEISCGDQQSIKIIEIQREGKNKLLLKTSY